jgi:hypothetical protein
MNPISPPQPAPVAPQEIERCELESVRRFLTSQRDEDRRATRTNGLSERKGPTIRNGITRARNRPAAKTSL